jgi:hypothetical protein
MIHQVPYGNSHLLLACRWENGCYMTFDGILRWHLCDHSKTETTIKRPGISSSHIRNLLCTGWPKNCTWQYTWEINNSCSTSVDMHSQIPCSENLTIAVIYQHLKPTSIPRNQWIFCIITQCSWGYRHASTDRDTSAKLLDTHYLSQPE